VSSADRGFRADDPPQLGHPTKLLPDQCPQLRGGFGLRRIVDVLSRCGDVGVAHPGLNVGDRELSDGHRAEAMAEIMETKRSQPTAFLRGAIPTSEPVVVRRVDARKLPLLILASSEAR
jgi:hypothetical protein